MSVFTYADAEYAIDETVATMANYAMMGHDPLMGIVFNLKGSNRSREVSATRDGLPRHQLKGSLQNPTSAIPQEQFKGESIHQPFALMVPLDRDVVDDLEENYDFITELGTDLGQSGIRTLEEDGAENLANSFGATTSIDGAALCGTHVNRAGVNSQVNRGTSALSADNVRTTRAAGRQLKSPVGNRVHIDLNTLIVPGALSDTAWEIAQGSGSAGSNANLPENNSLRGKINVITWEYLDEYDVDNWWMVDYQKSRDNLVYWVRIPHEVYGQGDLLAGTRTLGSYFRGSFQVKGWESIFGHQYTV